MMNEDAKHAQPYAMTTEELERTMRTLEPVYDVVRLVDPNLTQGCSLNEEGELGLPHCCFDLLAKGRRCHNCISARTVSSKRSVSKFEFVGEDAFYISTRYVEVDGEPRSLELVKRITDDSLLAPSEGDSPDGMRELLEAGSDRRYVDQKTGALNRRYLEEGIGALRGNKLAMLRATDLSDATAIGGTKARDLVLSAVAGTITGSIREVDTLVHFEDDTFVIIFEGIPRRLFSTRLEQIRQSVTQTLRQQMGAVRNDVLIGAVVRNDTVDDLVVLAQNALMEAEQGTSPIVLVAEGDAEDAEGMLQDAPELGQQAQAVDALTGLAAPHAFRSMLAARIERFASDKHPLRLVHVDIENFKAFNRAYGLPEGDILLIHLANAIREEFPGDLVTRASIDLFDIATRTEDVGERVERLRAHLISLRRDVALELKAGVCEVRDPGTEARSAMDRAKIACDSIKGKYDQTIRVFDAKLEHQVNMRDYIVKTLDDALALGHIKPYYQAIVRSFTGNACAMEALSRWEDPTFGLLSPADVIPTLERHHLIHKHDIHIVHCVCRDLRQKLDAGDLVVPVSVNLSRLDFELCDIFEEIEAAVTQNHIDRSLLGIEVTESTLDKSNTVFRPQVERFRAAGYEIWMDDFGSGYSSLNLLKDYDFDVLKIDMEFLRGMEGNQTSREIISSVVDMAKRIGIRTLAEGVETKAQFSFLKHIGCEMIQGYLFSRPVPFGNVPLGSGIAVERPTDRSYLESIGRVNLLSQEPTEAIRPADGGSELRGMPLAIMEWDGASMRFFTTNEAYLRHLHDLGYATVTEAQRELSLDSNLHERLQHIAEGGEDETGTIQFVARNKGAVAFLVSPLHALT